MTTKEIITVKATGGQVDTMAMALIDAAYDREPKVRDIIAASLVELGKKQPELLLTSCLVYLQTHTKLSQGHKIQILQSMTDIIKHDNGTIQTDVALQVIKHVSAEMTAKKDVTPELQGAASCVLVACGKHFCAQVMEELLSKFQPGVLPHFFVVETLGSLATANVFAMLPFLKATLGTMLPMLGLAKGDNMKWVFATALAKFCEAILDYIANIEKAPDPDVKKEAFQVEIGNAFDVLLNVWIHSKEPRLRVAVVEALGQMSQVVSAQKLQELLPKLLPAITGLYKKHTEPYHVTQSLCMVLDAATQEGSTMLEPHFDNLNGVLFPQVCLVIDYTNPLTVKNHNEVLRCYAVLARSFSDQLVAFCIQKLEIVNDKTRIGVLCLLRHLINSAGPYMESKKSLVLTGLKILLNDSTNKVKKMLAQTIIAMAHHGYLELEGGQEMIGFIVKQCSLPQDPPTKRPNDLEYVSNDALRSMCNNVLQLLSTTVDGIDKILWPYLLEFLVLPQYAGAMVVLCQSISHIVGKKREEVAVDLEVNFDRRSNLPKPQAILARLLVLAGWPCSNNNRGLAALQALKELGPVLNEYVSSLWDTLLPKLITNLEESLTNEQDWNQAAWEDLLLKFLVKSCEQIGDEEWIMLLAESLGSQLPLYVDHPNDKNFLFKCLGLTLKKLTRKDVVSKQLELMFQNVKHSNPVEREGCGIGVGHVASSHLDTVLTKLEIVGKFDSNKRSSGLFGFIKDSVQMRSEADDGIRATVILCYGYVTMYAPPDLIVSHLEAVIARVILPQLDSVKETPGKCNLIMAVKLVAEAMHPKHLKMNHTFTLRTRLLLHMQSFIKAEKPSQLTSEVRACAMNAAAQLVKLDPLLSDAELCELISTSLNSVMSLPPEGTSNRNPKEETYEEHVEVERLIKVTHGALLELLTQIVLKDLTPGGLLRVIMLLRPWSCSDDEIVRERAVTLMSSLCNVHLQYVDPVKAGAAFSTLGNIVGWVVPRCSDPSLSISHLAIDLVRCLLKTSAKYEGKGTEHKDDVVDSLPKIKERLNKNDSTTLFSVTSELAKVIQKKTPPSQLPALLDSLFDGLLDNQAQSSSGACVVLNSIIKARGGELHSQVDNICKELLERLKEISNQQTRIGTFRLIGTLANHHLLQVLTFLLQQPLPLDRNVEECWQILGHDHQLTVKILDHLLEMLARILPYEEKPDPRYKDETLRVASLQPLVITCSLEQLCKSREVQPTVVECCPQLLAAMMLRVASSIGTKPPRIIKEQVRDKRVVTMSKELEIDPGSSAISACQQVIQSSLLDNFSSALATADVWRLLENEDNLPEAFTLFARCLVLEIPQHVSKIITYLIPSLGSVYPPHRVMVAAVFAEFIAHNCAGDLERLDMLTNNFIGRLVDTDQRVRMLSIRGLGNIASVGPDQFSRAFSMESLKVQKYATTVLSAMMSGMDDKDDIDGSITLEAMEGLSKIIKKIDEQHVRSILINIALKIRPCFEKEKPAIRSAAVKLFGNLSRFGDGPSKEPFLEQIHTNLVSLLLHLNDPDPDVTKACKIALRQIGPLVGSEEANSMFQKHLLEEGTLLYGEFINDLTKVLLSDFEDKANFYVMGAVTFFRSDWPEIRSNAAMFTGFLLGNMSPKMYVTVSKEHVSNALVLLLKDPSPFVRIKAAEAMSWLHDL